MNSWPVREGQSRSICLSPVFHTLVLVQNIWSRGRVVSWPRGQQHSECRSGKEFPGSLGDSAKGALLTTFEKKKIGLQDGKRRHVLFWFQSPYGIFIIRRSPEQLVGAAWGSKKGECLPQPTENDKRWQSKQCWGPFRDKCEGA